GRGDHGDDGPPRDEPCPGRRVPPQPEPDEGSLRRRLPPDPPGPLAARGRPAGRGFPTAETNLLLLHRRGLLVSAEERGGEGSVRPGDARRSTMPRAPPVREAVDREDPGTPRLPLL